MAEKDLEALRDEMTKLAEHLDTLDEDLSVEAVASILIYLVEGKTAETIIEDFGLIHEIGA